MLFETTMTALGFLALAQELGPDSLDDPRIHTRINEFIFPWLRQRPGVRRWRHLFAVPAKDRSAYSLKTDAGTYEGPSRFSLLVVRAYVSATEGGSELLGASLPSPAQIVLDFLTIPSEPASRAFAMAAVRTYLFESLDRWPIGDDDSGRPNCFTIAEVDSHYRSLITHISGRDSFDLRGTSPVKALVGHFLAMQGYLSLRFGTDNDRQTIEDPYEARLKYCSTRKLSGAVPYEFRKNSEWEELPTIDAIVNELWSMPLPIRGARTVFYGGLKFAESGGLVISISGAPGSGKTSVALGLGAGLMAMGGRVFYLVAEEGSRDIRARLATVRPAYLGQIGGQARYAQESFFPYRISASSYPDGGNVLEQLVGELEQALSPSQDADHGLPCSLVVVIDGIQQYLPTTTSNYPTRDSETALSRCIERLRKLRALVVITCAENLIALESLSYLVDIGVRLEHRFTDAQNEKPQRLFRLEKTRYQISRPGAHLLHFGGSDGVRIVPSLGSQLDQRALRKVRLGDAGARVQALNRIFAADHRRRTLEEVNDRQWRQELPNWPVDTREFCSIPAYSQILLQGRGSAGKAGLGLKILSAPIVSQSEPTHVPREHRTRRILIASFLYPRAYYLGLQKRLEQLHDLEYPELQTHLAALRSEHATHELEVLHFYPGYLNPEDFVAKILRKLDAAELEGTPYSGVLLDGIHNVFLQFPRLEKNPMVWPVLYDALRRRRLTVVTTHTTISLRPSEEPATDLQLRQALPLLHAIIQAADFLFQVERRPSSADAADSELTPGCLFEVLQSTGQAPPKEHLLWHREKLVLSSFQIRKRSRAQGDLFPGETSSTMFPSPGRI